MIPKSDGPKSYNNPLAQFIYQLEIHANLEVPNTIYEIVNG